VASWLHPWQGETLLLVVIGSELVLWRSAIRVRPLLLPALTVAGALLPLAYYWVLGRTDTSWMLARDASHHIFPLAAIVLALLPLLIGAAVACSRRPRGFEQVATRAWPLASLTIFVLSGTALSATPLHAFDGITLPLSVLAVEGVQRLRWGWLPRRRLLAVLALLAATVPATVYQLWQASELAAPGSGNPNFIRGSEEQALDYLASTSRPGGVLTRFYLGTVVPEWTGRHTYIGHCLWSEPGCDARAETTQAMLKGQLSASATLSFVKATGARFVLSDCDANADLSEALRPILGSVRRFGCAAVYELS
jgi:hypothetical protein